MWIRTTQSSSLFTKNFQEKIEKEITLTREENISTTLLEIHIRFVLWILQNGSIFTIGKQFSIFQKKIKILCLYVEFDRVRLFLRFSCMMYEKRFNLSWPTLSMISKDFQFTDENELFNLKQTRHSTVRVCFKFFPSHLVESNRAVLFQIYEIHCLPLRLTWAPRHNGR